MQRILCILQVEAATVKVGSQWAGSSEGIRYGTWKRSIRRTGPLLQGVLHVNEEIRQTVVQVLVKKSASWNG